MVYTDFGVVSSGHGRPDGHFDGLVFGDVAEPFVAADDAGAIGASG